MHHCARDSCHHRSQHLEWKTSPGSWSIGIADLRPDICYNWRTDYRVTCWTCPRPCISRAGDCKFSRKPNSNPSLCVTNVYQSLVEFVLIISGSVFGGRGINTSYWWSFLRCIIPLTILPYLLISLDRESWGVGGVGDHRSRLVDCLGLCFRRRTYRSVLYVPVVPLSFSPRLLLLLLPCALVVYWFHTASLWWWWGASLVALAIFTLNEQTNPKLF